jgi:hypothetical protein
MLRVPHRDFHIQTELLGLYLYIKMSFAWCLEQLHEQPADGEQAELDKDGADGGVNLRQLHCRQPRRLEPTGAVASSNKNKLLQSVKSWIFGPLRKMFYLTLD